MVREVVSEAHPHTGIVPPFKAGDPGVKLDNSAIQTLKRGDLYKTQISDGSSGRGLVVQDVKAPTEVVWGRILDFGNYYKMVPKTAESSNYKVLDGKNGHQTIYTMLKVGFPMLKLTGYFKHEYEPKLNCLTWTLDYSRKSDFDDSCGFWYVIPHPDNPKEWSRVYYSVQVAMFPWVPGFVMSFMSTKALTESTAWVKKFSELEYAKVAPSDRSATADSSSDEGSDKTTKKKKIWFKRLFQRGNKDNGGDTADDETCAESDDDESNDAKAGVVPTKEAGLKRYALVAVVAVLSLYNVHLYLSQ